MKTILILMTCLSAFKAFSHGGDSGPSSLVDEFSKTSHIHLPVSYSPSRGLSYGYHIGGHEDHHEEENHEHDEHDDVHADETGFEVTIHPKLIAGFDKIKRYVALEESSSQNLVIERASEDKEFLLIENKKWDLGLGIGAETHLPIPMFAVGPGISFLKGKNYYSMRKLQTKNEKRSPLLLPFTKEAIAGWRSGDELSYATKGSLILSALIGIDPFVHFGPIYSHTGTYKFKVSMQEEDKLQVELITTSTDSISFEGNVIWGTVEVGKSKGHAASIIYEFDLTHPKSLGGIHALFQGRLDVVNDLLVTSGHIKLKTDFMNRGTFVSGNLGLPYVYFNGNGRGVYQSEGWIDEVEEGHKMEVFVTSSVQERFTRGILSKHRWENKSIVSTIMRGDHSLISSILSWSFGQDMTNSFQIENKLQSLGALYGFDWLKDIKLPEGNLGYVKADFNLNLSGHDVLHILNGDELKKLKLNAIMKLEDDFREKGHRAFCKVRSFSDCLRRYKNLINHKMMKVVEARRKLEATYQKGNLSEVTKNLTEVAGHVFASRYLTKAFVQSTPDLLAELRLEGESIKKTVIKSPEN